MRICSLCNHNHLYVTDYFCEKCYHYLLIFYKLTPLDLEEYLNLSFRDIWIFQFEVCDSFECAYDLAKLFITDLKPLINIVEYVLLYKRISNIIRYENMLKMSG